MLAKFIESKRLVTWVIISLVAGYAIVSMTKTNSVSESVSEIEKLGGRIGHVDQNEAIRNVRSWLNKKGWSTASSLISRRFSPVSHVFLDGKGVTDDYLTHLKDLTHLRFLSLRGTQVTDAGLAHLKGLTELRTLLLSNTQITDAGLVHLEGLTQLRILYLRDTQVTDKGREELKRAIPGLDIR